MPDFESVTADEFKRILADAPASSAFREHYFQFAATLYDGCNGPDFQIHRGDIVIDGDFTAPGLATLVLGTLTVSGYIDLRNDDTKGFDEGGLFVVLGDLRCRVFSGHYGKCSFVDGDLVATDLLLNSYEDSTLIVTGHLRTHFFLGDDIWANVGTGADMSYGIGYVLPLDNETPVAAILPRHDETASRAVLVEDFFNQGEEPSAGGLMALVRSGQPVFR